MRELTPKQKAFADEYIKNGGNATQAYISAGYSEKGADRSASKLLRNTEVLDYIAKKQSLQEKKFGNRKTLKRRKLQLR